MVVGEPPTTSVYGPAGTVGLLVPPGNPTVEPELARLLDPAILPLTMRMASASGEIPDRLVAYHDGLGSGRWLDGFTGLHLDAVGYACTGSAYLVGPEDDAAASAALEERTGTPVVTAFGALSAALSELAPHRVALLNPYPDVLTEACVRTWAGLGYGLTIGAVRSSGDRSGHPIYRLRLADVARALAELPIADVDVVVLAGTGMASLAVLRDLACRGIPAVSSNLCLAWALQRRVAPRAAVPLERWLAAGAPWHRRLADTETAHPSTATPQPTPKPPEAHRAG